jgi:hypothetical protein
MLHHALRTWDRLVGRSAADPGPEEDRRVWVRYPCHLETTVLSTKHPDAERLSAQVRDVSCGGIRLAADRSFEPGELLSVDLPAAPGQACSSVLAYVVRAARHPDGTWSVGCTFASELSDDDLQLFGAKRQKPIEADQRAWVRFPCDARAFFQPVRETTVEPVPAQVLNISPSGVALQAEYAIDLGTLLSVELRGPHGSSALTMMASVVRVTPQEGGWALGCNFIRELSDRELQALLN